MSKLIVAEAFYNADGIMGVRTNGSDVPVSYWAHWRYGPTLPNRVNPVGDVTSPTVTVFVNHGRWMIKCPFGCGSAQVASETDKRFYCATCENSLAGNNLIPANWPDVATQALIEDALLPRLQVNQNWDGETVDGLLAENVANEVGF